MGPRQGPKGLEGRVLGLTGFCRRVEAEGAARVSPAWSTVLLLNRERRPPQAGD